jgi:arylsulfatase A-like enzyme
MRVPGIAWMPGRLKPAVTSVPASFLDLYPTALALAGVPAPTGVTLDGTSLLPLLVEGRELGERAYFFYRGFELFACRLGDWKAHFQTQAGYGQPKPEAHERPLLFRLPHDPGERHEVGAAHPEVLARIQEAVARHRAELRPGAPQFK